MFILNFLQISQVTPHCQNIRPKLQLLNLSGLQLTPSQFIEAKFKEELDNLLDDGIIEESDRLWCSPPIPVKKKDMSICIVDDYRNSNSVTVNDPFYMPSRLKR